MPFEKRLNTPRVLETAPPLEKASSGRITPAPVALETRSSVRETSLEPLFPLVRPRGKALEI